LHTLQLASFAAPTTRGSGYSAILATLVVPGRLIVLQITPTTGWRDLGAVSCSRLPRWRRASQPARTDPVAGTWNRSEGPLKFHTGEHLFAATSRAAGSRLAVSGTTGCRCFDRRTSVSRGNCADRDAGKNIPKIGLSPQGTLCVVSGITSEDYSVTIRTREMDAP